MTFPVFGDSSNGGKEGFPRGKVTFPRFRVSSKGGKLTFPRFHGSSYGGKTTFPRFRDPCTEGNSLSLCSPIRGSEGK